MEILEEIAKSKANIEQFERKYGVSKQFAANAIDQWNDLGHKTQGKDIFGYKDRDAFGAAVDEMKMTLSKREHKRIMKDKEATVVFENDNFLIVHPHSFEASCTYGANTKWCTTWKDQPQHFFDYQEDLMVILYALPKVVMPDFEQNTAYWEVKPVPVINAQIIRTQGKFTGIKHAFQSHEIQLMKFAQKSRPGMEHMVHSVMMGCLYDAQSPAKDSIIGIAEANVWMWPNKEEITQLGMRYADDPKALFEHVQKILTDRKQQMSEHFETLLQNLDGQLQAARNSEIAPGKNKIAMIYSEGRFDHIMTAKDHRANAAPCFKVLIDYGVPVETLHEYARKHYADKVAILRKQAMKNVTDVISLHNWLEDGTYGGGNLRHVDMPVEFFDLMIEDPFEPYTKDIMEDFLFTQDDIFPGKYKDLIRKVFQGLHIRYDTHKEKRIAEQDNQPVGQMIGRRIRWSKKDEEPDWLYDVSNGELQQHVNFWLAWIRSNRHSHATYAQDEYRTKLVQFDELRDLFVSEMLRLLKQHDEDNDFKFNVIDGATFAMLKTLYIEYSDKPGPFVDKNSTLPSEHKNVGLPFLQLAEKGTKEVMDNLNQNFRVGWYEGVADWLSEAVGSYASMMLAVPNHFGSSCSPSEEEIELHRKVSEKITPIAQEVSRRWDEGIDDAPYHFDDDWFNEFHGRK